MGAEKKTDFGPAYECRGHKNLPVELHEDEDVSTEDDKASDMGSTGSHDSSNESLEVEVITDDFLFIVEDIV